MEVTCDFRRYYNLTFPQCLSELKGQTAYDLLEGLLHIEGTLYSAWMLTHSEFNSKAKGKRRIPVSSWSTSVSLLMEIRNMLTSYMGKNVKEDDLVYPPEPLTADKEKAPT